LATVGGERVRQVRERLAVEGRRQRERWMGPRLVVGRG
jgi:hypothetical protein